MSLPFATALRESLRQGYTLRDLRADLLAGITLGIIAVPLAMALAIASGVPPQYGLYTAIIAGAVIALSGGSRFSVSGPTAAFVVILLPVTSQYGLGGLLLATLMAGVILLLMGLLKLGRLIQFIPAPVTLGFTAGIALVIASLQLKDFFGLQEMDNTAHFFIKLLSFIDLLPAISWGDLLVGLVTLTTLILWPRLKTPVPGHLPALLLGTALALLGPGLLPGFEAILLGDQFSWTLGDESGRGIPPVAPSFILPWLMPGADGEPIGLSWDLFAALLPAAFTIALLGAIESLLCAVVGDSLTGTKHDPNAELVGQGLGNLAAPFFGGITATGALARTAANIKSGARSPLASFFHALMVLACILIFADWLSWLPMAALAGLLLMVAWNMSEAHHVLRMIRIAPRSDLLVLLTCFSLTVMFDMVLAVGVGIVLASLLFMGRMAQVTESRTLSEEEHKDLQLPEKIACVEIAGPLFFGAAEKTLGRLGQVSSGIEGVFLDFTQVPSLDVTAMESLHTALQELEEQQKTVVFIGLQPHLILKLRKAGIRSSEKVHFAHNLAQASLRWQNEQRLKDAPDEKTGPTP
ncbi:C4-dicarboxylic acid transporter DauA [Marinospirillum alkaliphilum]|uniref:Sulfate permease, SulP family n=1 Tax=Marinospirillum alkaliphilum DSM 21637 TaxID=1122209 RepID=A0A1K1VWV7_9GAMM|nr:C4-dicarboxylic acid transporter DauA [Marinospirillum alkaliphilum]SFX29495.1 sulfate permease, SulP family [Marinospirillum alkaliphilum DSM 21637]